MSPRVFPGNPDSWPHHFLLSDIRLVRIWIASFFPMISFLFRLSRNFCNRIRYGSSRVRARICIRRSSRRAIDSASLSPNCPLPRAAIRCIATLLLGYFDTLILCYFATSHHGSSTNRSQVHPSKTTRFLKQSTQYLYILYKVYLMYIVYTYN